MLEEDRDAGGDTYYCFSCWEEWEMENYAREYNAEQEECQSESDTDLDTTHVVGLSDKTLHALATCERLSSLSTRFRNGVPQRVFSPADR